MRTRVDGRAWDLEYTGPVAEIDTEFGPVTAVFTDGGHAHVQIGYTEYGRTPHDGGPAFTFRGKTYTGDGHFHGLDGGTCHWQERNAADECGKTGMHHHGSPWVSIPDAAPTYRTKMIGAMSDAVAGYAAEHPEVLAVAERNHAEHNHERALKEFGEAEAAFAEAESKFDQTVGHLSESRKAEAAALAEADQRAAQPAAEMEAGG